MHTSDSGNLKVVFRIDFLPNNRMGRGKVQLLEQIKATGSITSAGKTMNMSYRRAWLLVQQMNTMFSCLVVEPQRGGKSGGGARLTEFGEELLAHFKRMEKKIEHILEKDLDWLATHRSILEQT